MGKGTSAKVNTKMCSRLMSFSEISPSHVFMCLCLGQCGLHYVDVRMDAKVGITRL